VGSRRHFWTWFFLARSSVMVPGFPGEQNQEGETEVSSAFFKKTGAAVDFLHFHDLDNFSKQES